MSALNSEATVACPGGVCSVKEMVVEDTEVDGDVTVMLASGRSLVMRRDVGGSSAVGIHERDSAAMKTSSHADFGPAVLQHLSSSWSAHMPLIAGSIVGFVFAAVALFYKTAAECGTALYPSSSDRPLSDRMLPVAFYGLVFLVAITNTAMIPESFNLSQHLGQEATFSGFLICLPYGTYGVSIFGARRLAAQPQPPTRAAVLLACGLCTAFALLFATVSGFKGGFTDRMRVTLIVLARAGLGIAGGATALFRIALQKVTPAEKLVSFNVLRSVSMDIGLGAGPLLSSGLCWALDINSVGGRTAAPAFLIAVSWALLTLIVWVLLPTTFGQPLTHDSAESSSPIAQASTLSSAGPCEESSATTLARQRLWVMALVFGCERALVMSALEASASLIFQIEFGFGTPLIGLAIGVSFLLGMPLFLALLLAQQRGLISETNSFSTLSCASVAATLLLFTWSGPLLGCPGCAAGLILAADTFLFPSGYFCNGVADGLAARYAVEGSFFSQDNFVAIAQFSRSVVARMWAPPVARWLIATHGRDTYALVQLVLCLSASMCAFAMKRLVDVCDPKANGKAYRT